MVPIGSVDSVPRLRGLPRQTLHRVLSRQAFRARNRSDPGTNLTKAPCTVAG